MTDGDEGHLEPCFDCLSEFVSLAMESESTLTWASWLGNNTSAKTAKKS